MCYVAGRVFDRETVGIFRFQKSFLVAKDNPWLWETAAQGFWEEENSHGFALEKAVPGESLLSANPRDDGV